MQQVSIDCDLFWKIVYYDSKRVYTMAVEQVAGYNLTPSLTLGKESRTYII